MCRACGRRAFFSSLRIILSVRHPSLENRNDFFTMRAKQLSSLLLDLDSRSTGTCLFLFAIDHQSTNLDLTELFPGNGSKLFIFIVFYLNPFTHPYVERCM